MTAAGFWGFIKSALRQKSRWWKPVRDVKLAARRPYCGPKKQQRWEYQCACCQAWFPDKETQVDHITPVGSLKGPDDLPGVVSRMFVEKDGLQVLCSGCHGKKTQQDLIAIRG